MLSNLHAEYVKAAAPRPRPHAVVEVLSGADRPPPGRRGRARLALTLAAAARRLDGDAARRVVA